MALPRAPPKRTLRLQWARLRGLVGGVQPRWRPHRLRWFHPNGRADPDLGNGRPGRSAIDCLGTPTPSRAWRSAPTGGVSPRRAGTSLSRSGTSRPAASWPSSAAMAMASRTWRSAPTGRRLASSDQAGTVKVRDGTRPAGRNPPSGCRRAGSGAWRSAPMVESSSRGATPGRSRSGTAPDRRGAVLRQGRQRAAGSRGLQPRRPPAGLGGRDGTGR